MEIKKGNKKINIGKVKKVNWFGKVVGLMFCRREKAKALLFEFKKPVRWRFHSWFVFFSFIAVWLDDKNKIVDLKTVKPFKFNLSPKKAFRKVIEIPINEEYSRIIKTLVGDRNIKNQRFL